MERTLPLNRMGMEDLPRVGGKNASLGEMIKALSAAGVRVPGGFATTADAFREFLESNDLSRRIQGRLATLDSKDVRALADAGSEIRSLIRSAPLPAELEEEIRRGYAALCEGLDQDIAVAVRSSATAEDLPDASFAGQQETLLNVRGADAVVDAVREVFSSLFNDRAISYREHRGFVHEEVSLSAGIQRMVRSDIGASGVAFTIDTESGFQDAILITSAWGLGEMVVQGQVNPDEFCVYKPALVAGRPAILRRERGSKALKMIYHRDPAQRVEIVDVPHEEKLRFSLDDDDVIRLAHYALAIENHYGRAMDIEWAKDGIDGEIHILQARPETVQSRGGEKDPKQTIERFSLRERGPVLAAGRSIGQRIGAGKARRVLDVGQMDRVEEGDVLITDMTDPDWEPVMKRASAIVTNRGGRTCHAAIIARELGIPAVVGTGDATRKIEEGTEVTVSCAEGETGYVYGGRLDFECRRIDVDTMPPIPVKIAMNIGNPDRAFAFRALPNAGVGLARLEFIIGNSIGVHPQALLDFERLPISVKEQVEERIAGYGSPRAFFIEKLVEGVSTIAAAFHPKPVIVRLSDFKSDEYANLLGGDLYEPDEANPMLGFRGASRYVSEGFRACFELECQALRRVRNEMGLTNLELMVPFVRTLNEARDIQSLLAHNGLERGRDSLRVIMMCEVPSNAILAEEFLEYFDGLSIGSNDLTQMTLGLDRNSALVATHFDERDPAVKALLRRAIKACRDQGKYVGICGQGPSDYPDFAHWLVDEGISSMSLNPDSVVDTWLYLGGKGGAVSASSGEAS
ncbi:phosphoenolpyruvate synthase [Thioalkalivibrio sp. HK1]|uniref:phosphoenolpyruvate synthase n=1 Tax=Thioalkalivibrio sp. HK1 TaxID=1469245 RepID=UPI000471E785|nr:phosphoenolpyruvate synthase [Thioalkalivibrio sp. HK1]